VTVAHEESADMKIKIEDEVKLGRNVNVKGKAVDSLFQSILKFEKLFICHL